MLAGGTEEMHKPRNGKKSAQNKFEYCNTGTSIPIRDTGHKYLEGQSR